MFCWLPKVECVSCSSSTPRGRPLNQDALPGSMRNTSSRSFCASTEQPTGRPTAIMATSNRQSRRALLRNRKKRCKGVHLDDQKAIDGTRLPDDLQDGSSQH